MAVGDSDGIIQLWDVANTKIIRLVVVTLVVVVVNQ